MRRRIVLVTLAAVFLAVALFGGPLAIAVSHTIRADERGELERLALRGAVAVGPDFQSGDPIELPKTERGVELAVYDPDGALVTGDGPARVESALQPALDGDLAEADTQDRLLAAVPVSVGEKVIALVRASSAKSAVQSRIWLAWGGMAAMALLAGACAGGFAAALSRRLIRPLTRLEAVAAALGAGNFAVRANPSGVEEIDNAGDAINKTAARLGDLVARERAFSAAASHQLRTPLTSLRLALESALEAEPAVLRAAAQDAIISVDHLSRTIDDVLAVARSQQPPGERFDVDLLLDDVRDRWQGVLAAQDRPFRVESDHPPRSRASLAAARQILEVMIDNAYRHGRGVVTVRARETGGAVAIDVIDDGSAALFSLADPSLSAETGSDRRIGLGLARTLADGQGGRLVQSSGEQRTRFTVFLPAAEPFSVASGEQEQDEGSSTDIDPKET